MRKLLVTINIVLGVFLLFGITKNIAASKADAAKENQIKLLPLPKSSKNDSKNKNAAQPLPEVDEAAKKIIALDVFNNVRSPLANVRNSRTQLTLVGIFRCGKTEGAIIRQNNRNRQFNPYIAQMMMQAGMGGGMGNRGGNMGGGNRGRLFGGGNMGGSGRFTSWSQMSGRNSGADKQYVRVGDTLSNGYTLAEVTRTGATLIRGNDRLELELQDPSKNRSSGNYQNRRANPTQQFQQAQMFMQGQMMRTMQQMQRTIQSNSGGGNRNRGGARR